MRLRSNGEAFIQFHLMGDNPNAKDGKSDRSKPAVPYRNNRDRFI